MIICSRCHKETNGNPCMSSQCGLKSEKEDNIIRYRGYTIHKEEDVYIIRSGLYFIAECDSFFSGKTYIDELLSL